MNPQSGFAGWAAGWLFSSSGSGLFASFLLGAALLFALFGTGLLFFTGLAFLTALAFRAAALLLGVAVVSGIRATGATMGKGAGCDEERTDSGE